MTLSEIKSEHSYGVVRRELAPAECAQQPERPAALAHLCSETRVCERRYNTAWKREECRAGVVRRRRRHHQNIPVGSSQSIIPYAHSATPFARLMIIARNHLSKVDTVTIAHTRLCTKAHRSLPRHGSKTDRGRSRLMDGSRELNLAASFASGVSFRCRIGAALVRRPDRMSGKQAQTWEVPNVRACKDRSSPGKPNWCTLTMAKQHRDCARTQLGRDSTA